MVRMVGWLEVGWFDSWMAGWLDGWMGGWVDGWMVLWLEDGRIVGWLKLLDGCILEFLDGFSVGTWYSRMLDGWIVGLSVGWMEG
jgi:hypothetical protein